jgi:hypothetical protein
MSDQVIITLKVNGDTEVVVRRDGAPNTIEGTITTPEIETKRRAGLMGWLDASARWVGGVIKSVLS